MTKKRYTKKKKSVQDKESTDIPFTKVRVEWVDCVSDSAWASEKEFKNKHEVITTSPCLLATHQVSLMGVSIRIL